MTTKTDEQERAAFEAWAASIGFCVTGKYAATIDVLCAESAFKAGYRAGRAALQSQDREGENVWLKGMEERVRLFGKAHADKEPFSVRLKHFREVMAYARRRIEGDGE